MIQHNDVSIEIEVFISRKHAVVRPSTSRDLHWMRHTVLNLPSADTNLNSSIQPAFKVDESQNPFHSHCFCYLLLTQPTAINLSMWRNGGITHTSDQFIVMSTVASLQHHAVMLLPFKRSSFLASWELVCYLVFIATELLAQSWGRWKEPLISYNKKHMSLM